MAEFKFSCPGCNQHIQLDELWSGHQIQCPSCQTTMVVPPNPDAPAPAASPVQATVRGVPGPPPVPASTRLSKAAAPSAAAAPSPQGQTRFMPQRGAGKAAPGSSRKSKIIKWATIGAVVLAVGAGAYFGIPYALDYQDKLNAKRKEDAKKSDGGEMGHIANVYNVLDATEPGGRGLSGLPKGHGPRERSEQMSFPVVPAHVAGAASIAQPDLPVIPAVWSLDAVATNIPQGRANGMLSGTNFLVETARLEPVGTAEVLHLLQGTVTSPDRELFIYLHPKSGGGLSGQSWTVTKAQTGIGVPEIKKRWKTDPRYAPQLKSFATGYVLKLELGEVTNSAVSGKIYLALPDDEKSVVAGVFNAVIMAAAPVGVSQAPAAPHRMQSDSLFQERYGKKRP